MDDGRQSNFLFAALGDAIADLPERERLVFTLYYYEELETSEIALAIGETRFAVFELHASSLRRLKARLADPEPALEADRGRNPSWPSTVVWTQEHATQDNYEPSY
jgi:DNA-directed RNA polymerase specialized sigma24 family protein